MKMKDACKRMGVWVGVGMSAIVLVIPACLLLVWVAVGCMWVLGLLSVMKLVLRLMWNPRIGAERKLKKEKKKMRKKEAGGMSDHGSFFLTQDYAAEIIRLSLFQQYLDDQLNTLGYQLLHVCCSDSLPNHVDFPFHVDSCDWPPSHVDDQDCLQIKGGETDQQMLCL